MALRFGRAQPPGPLGYGGPWAQLAKEAPPSPRRSQTVTECRLASRSSPRLETASASEPGPRLRAAHEGCVPGVDAGLQRLRLGSDIVRTEEELADLPEQLPRSGMLLQGRHPWRHVGEPAVHQGNAGQHLRRKGAETLGTGPQRAQACSGSGKAQRTVTPKAAFADGCRNVRRDWGPGRLSLGTHRSAKKPGGSTPPPFSDRQLGARQQAA